MLVVGEYKIIGRQGGVLPPRLHVTVIVLVLLLVNLVIAAVPPLLWRETWDYVNAVIVVLLHVPVLLFHVMTSFRDPGIIPNAELAQQLSDDEVKLSSTPNQSSGELVVKSDVFSLKYCTTCGSHRPLRAVHSRIGNCCIMRYDHFCKWLGTDIGMCNHWWFLCFLHSLLAESVAFGIVAITEMIFTIVRRNLSLRLVASLTLWSASLLASVIIAEFVSKLVIYYARLARFGMLTKEHAVGCNAETTAPFSTFNTFENYCLPHRFRKESLLKRFLATPATHTRTSKDCFQFDRCDVKLWFEQAVILSKRFVFSESAAIERQHQECPDRFDMRTLNEEIGKARREPSFVISIEDPWKK